MKKSNILTMAITTALLSVVNAHAGDESDSEKCKIIDKNGKGLIREHKADCASKNNSCAGTNKAGDPEAWIIVPKGQCAKINRGEYNEVDDNIKAKFDIAELNAEDALPSGDKMPSPDMDTQIDTMDKMEQMKQQMGNKDAEQLEQETMENTDGDLD